MKPQVANLLWMAVPVFCVCEAGSELADLVMRSGIGHVDSSFDPASQLAALDRCVDRAATLDRPRQKTRVRPLYAGLFSMQRLPAILDAARRPDASMSHDAMRAFR